MRLTDRFFRGIGPKRRYGSYEEYVEHQKTKTLDPARRDKWLGEEWLSKVDGFKGIFTRNWDFVGGRTRALCLGARTGQEVVALQDLGIAAIGIDLVPCPPHVEAGDIHDLRFADDSFDLIFTNVVDHSIDPAKMVAEMERVCMAGGAILVHLCLGPDIDQFSATEIRRPKAVERLFTRSTIEASRPIRNGFDPMNWEIVARRL